MKKITKICGTYKEGKQTKVAFFIPPKVTNKNVDLLWEGLVGTILGYMELFCLDEKAINAMVQDAFDRAKSQHVSLREYPKKMKEQRHE